MLLRLRNIDLPLKVRRRRTTRSIKKNLKHMGRSIDERDSNVDERNEFGHWEIDTVIGSKSKSDNVVLTLVERITRKYIALKITSKTSFAVNEGIAYLKEYYGTKFSQVFKTITSDNGSEFAELSQIENDTSIKIYFAHPYSSWERGWTIIATKILCLSLIGVIHFQGRFWDIKLQMNCLTLSWIRSMHLNFQKVCNFLLLFRKFFWINLWHNMYLFSFRSYYILLATSVTTKL